MPVKGKKVDTGNWGAHPIVTSFVNLRWELNRSGKVIVFGRDAPLTCTGFSAVKQLLSFALPLSLGDSDTKVRVVIHSLIYDLLILMTDR